MRRLALALSLVTAIASCGGPEPPPSVAVETGDIVVVAPGERVQAAPPNEELAIVFSRAKDQASANGDDLGYPWIDPATGELVLSAVTPHGRDLVAGIATPHRVREVKHGAGELARIQDDVTTLNSLGVPDASLIIAVLPDHRDNRTLIVVRARSEPLLAALATRYPAGTLAVEIDPSGP